MHMRRLETTGLDDQDHLAVIGAAAAAALKANTQLLAPFASSPSPSWLQGAHTQGVSIPNEELDFLPFTSADFTNPAAATANVDFTSEIDANPQRPFRGERIILQAIYVPAAAAPRDGLFQVVISPALYVGAVQIGATQGRMPASAFGPTAFGIRLSMPTAGQGTRIYLPFVAIGIAPGDRIVLSGGIFGRAVR
jgi:hypothetical protein